MEYNGSAIMAMVGKDCVAIAADKRFGVQALTLGTEFQKVFPINNQLYLGLPGLASDVETLYASFLNDRHEQFRYKVNMYKMNEDRDITPKTFAHLVSSTLYEKRCVKTYARFGPYFVEPVIAGLEPNGTPFIASTDLIGCINFAKDFVVSGTASNMMYGMCESLWEPNLVI
jgi:20S proteasome subunit beta 3